MVTSSDHQKTSSTNLVNSWRESWVHRRAFSALSESQCFAASGTEVEWGGFGFWGLAPGVLGFTNFLARDKLGLAHLPLLLSLGSASYQSGDCGTACECIF